MTSLPIDPSAIRQLAEILSDTGLTEIELEHKDLKIRVARTPAPVAVQAPVAAPMHAAPAIAAAASVAESSKEDLAAHPGAVTSPMVGVAYLSPEPGSPPYIQVGQNVAAGQTLLLIEAMKTFNQIKAPKAGVVSRILAASGTPVEYGEVLVVIE